MTFPPTLGTALAGKYDVERELGAGGMATVYLARDVRHNRHVALKVMNPELGAAVGVERFLGEIRTTARLAHPNILPLHDSGEAGGHLYYVMPFVEGESLRARLTREGRLSIAEAVRLAREIAEALGYAHQHDVVHRDVKPENILLQSGHALVADFGIARVVSAAQDARITATGLALGTPAYMSPEQASGETQIDGRSDLYALGCMLYEMLVGEPPFVGPNARKVLALRLTQRPPRPSLKRAEVPPSLDSAVSTAMAPAPDDRHPTLEAFAAALSTPQVAGDGGKPRGSIAVLPFTNMSDDPANEYFSDGVSEEIINALAQLPGLHVAARTSAFSFKGSKLDLRAIGDQLGVGTVLEGSVRKAGNRLRVAAQLINVADGYHLWSERYDRDATDLFAVQDEIAAAIAAKFDIKVDDQPAGRAAARGTENLDAYDLYLRGRAFELERGPSLLRAVECFEQAVAIDAGYAAAHAELAKSLILLTMWGQRAPDYARATSAAQAALAADPNLVAGHTANALLAMLGELDRDKASASWSRAIEIDPGDGEAQSLRAIYDLSYMRGDTDAAVRAIQGAIDADPLNVSYWAHLSVVLAWGQRYEEAERTARRAVELGPRSFYAQWTLVQTQYFAPDANKGVASADNMLTWFGRHPWPLMGLAYAAGRAGKREIADAVYAELCARARSTYVQPIVLAVAALGAGRRDDVYRHFREAIRVRDPLFAMLIPRWPALATMRAEPEFKAILREVGWEN